MNSETCERLYNAYYMRVFSYVMTMAGDRQTSEEITQEVKDDKANTQKAIDEQKEKKQTVISGFAANNAIVHQLIDLALLQNGMLKGEALDKFLQRSVELIK